jgi:hypothetical protein
MKTYTGGCHCKKLRYEVTMDLGKVYECNCSICSKRGHLLTFVPMTQVKFLAGSVEESGGYRFGKNHVRHSFCPECGINAFSVGAAKDGTATFAVNVRCLDDVDLAALEIAKVDGKSRAI